MLQREAIQAGQDGLSSHAPKLGVNILAWWFIMIMRKKQQCRSTSNHPITSECATNLCTWLFSIDSGSKAYTYWIIWAYILYKLPNQWCRYHCTEHYCSCMWRKCDTSCTELPGMLDTKPGAAPDKTSRNQEYAGSTGKYQDDGGTVVPQLQAVAI
eukprot:9432851-Ditylum_brightwellii.AAC.1